MHRREFLTATAAAAFGLAATRMGLAADEGAGHTGGAAGSPGRQFYEIRTYHFAKSSQHSAAEKQQAFERFMADAAVPAYNRAGVKPVGVFKMKAEDNPTLKLTEEPTDLWVFLPHNSIESVLTLEGRLAADEAFQKAGRDVLNAPKSDPAFARYESMLLLAFEGAPRVEVPTQSDGRVFELRTYESHNQERAANKVQMFNTGEFPVFRRAGMPGVFFGSAVAGPDLPQLTYMVAHTDAQSIKKDWGAFGADAEWKKLSGNPDYKDNVSKIIARFLRPAAGSQI